MIRPNWLGFPPAIELHPGAVDCWQAIFMTDLLSFRGIRCLSCAVSSSDLSDTAVKVILQEPAKQSVSIVVAITLKRLHTSPLPQVIVLWQW